MLSHRPGGGPLVVGRRWRWFMAGSGNLGWILFTDSCPAAGNNRGQSPYLGYMKSAVEIVKHRRRALK